MTVRLTQRNYMDRIERGVSNGDVVLMENIGESVDAVLEPLLGRVLIRKGRVLKVSDGALKSGRAWSGMMKNAVVSEVVLVENIG